MAQSRRRGIVAGPAVPQHGDRFEASFPEADDPVRLVNFAKAIGAYKATPITPAPFDAWLNGNDRALTDTQKKGLALFVDNTRNGT